jgi:hypothetical protein
VNLDANPGALEYSWRWTTRLDGAKGSSVESDQSSMRGTVRSPEKLHKMASDHVPQFSDEGLLDRRILDLMDDDAALEEIARRLVSEFPERFTRWQNALTAAGLISTKYSR